MLGVSHIHPGSCSGGYRRSAPSARRAPPLQKASPTNLGDVKHECEVVPGVKWHPKHGGSRMLKNGKFSVLDPRNKHKTLSVFDTLEEAIAAREAGVDRKNKKVPGSRPVQHRLAPRLCTGHYISHYVPAQCSSDLSFARGYVRYATYAMEHRVSTGRFPLPPSPPLPAPPRERGIAERAPDELAAAVLQSGRFVPCELHGPHDPEHMHSHVDGRAAAFCSLAACAEHNALHAAKLAEYSSWSAIDGAPEVRRCCQVSGVRRCRM